MTDRIIVNRSRGRWVSRDRPVRRSRGTTTRTFASSGAAVVLPVPAGVRVGTVATVTLAGGDGGAGGTPSPGVGGHGGQVVFTHVVSAGNSRQISVSGHAPDALDGSGGFGGGGTGGDIQNGAIGGGGERVAQGERGVDRWPGHDNAGHAETGEECPDRAVRCAGPDQHDAYRSEARYAPAMTMTSLNARPESSLVAWVRVSAGPILPITAHPTC